MTRKRIISNTEIVAKRPASLVNPDAERGLIGSLLVAPERFDAVRFIVPTAEAFAVEACKRIYAAMLAIRDDGKLPELDAVFAYLNRIGGNDNELRGFAREAAQTVPIGDNAEAFARDVAALTRRRETALIAERIQRMTENGAEEASIAAAVDDLRASVAGQAESREGVRPVVVRLADVQPEAVRWLWPGRIALGKLTIVSGDPGLGKSFLSCDLAARVSLGAEWTDDVLSVAPRGGVVMLNCEDDLADTIRPRLDAHGADVSKIVSLSGVRDSNRDERERAFDLARDIPALEAAIASVDDCRLVVIDPVTAYLGERHDSHKASDVRALLAPLAALAARHRVAVVGISHLNKGNGAAMYRTMGSLAFVAAARAVWCVTKDQENPARRLFVPVKNNLGNDVAGLAYSIVEGVVAWEREPICVTADEALTRDPADAPRGELAEAVAWLRRELQPGVPAPSRAVLIDAKEHGIGEKALRKAAKRLGVVIGKSGYRAGWTWTLPEDADGPPSPERESSESSQETWESSSGIGEDSRPEKADVFGETRTKPQPTALVATTANSLDPHGQ